MTSKPQLTDESLIVLLEKQRSAFTDQYCPLLTTQEETLRKAVTLIEEPRDSMKRNYSRQKANAILNDIWKCISPEVFVLCALATTLSALGTSKLCNYVSTIGCWWEGVYHPTGLAMLSKKYGLRVFKTASFVQGVHQDILGNGEPVSQSYSEHRSLNDGSPDKLLAIPTEVERPRKRKRKLMSTDYRSSEHAAGATDSLGPEHSETPMRGRLLESLPESNEEAQQTASHGVSISSMIAQGRMIEHASIAGVTEVFAKDMCDAIWRVKIRKNGLVSLKATATMNFPLWGLVDCLLSLDVHEERHVEQLAMALFNIQVKSVGHARYIILPGGVRLTPNSEVTLKGVLDDAIISVFGSVIHSAITTCRMRKKELEEGSQVTECVSMILTSSADDGAIINLSLGVKGAAQIRNYIFRIESYSSPYTMLSFLHLPFSNV